MTSRQQQTSQDPTNPSQANGLHVFTYGSLMYRDIFEAVTQSALACMDASLPGWSRHGLINREYPGAMPDKSGEAMIRGVLWLNVGVNAVAALDQFEGNEYQRVSVKVSGADGLPYEAVVYQWLDPAAICGAWSSRDFELKHRKNFVIEHWHRDGTRS